MFWSQGEVIVDGMGGVFDNVASPFADPCVVYVLLWSICDDMPNFLSLLIVDCFYNLELVWSGLGCTVCDTVLHVYEPVYKPVVQQRYHLLTCFFSKLT